MAVETTVEGPVRPPNIASRKLLVLHMKISRGDNNTQKVMGVSKPKLPLTFIQCIEALQRYIVAGALCDQFEYSALVLRTWQWSPV